MSPKRTLATTERVLRQLRHDHRTLALLFLVPAILLTLLYLVFEGNRPVFNSVAPLLLGIIPFLMMFIVASVAVLRERTSGTLERLLTSPASKLEIIFGYAIAFAVLAFVQATIATFVTISLLGVTVIGSVFILLLIAVLSGVMGMSFGLLFSAFAKNEFQAVQFMPAFVLPQLLTCGLFIPRDQMNQALQYFSAVMPLTYVIRAIQEVQKFAVQTPLLIACIIVILMFTAGALLHGANTLKK